jgi:hypothetical protein
VFKYPKLKTLAPTNDQVFLSLWVPLAVWAGAAYLVDPWVTEHIIARIIYFGLPPATYLLLFLVPRFRSNSVFSQFVKGWFKTVGVYSLLVSASAVLLLLGASALGYLPYSDRPGPGWGSVAPHLPGVDELGYFSGWAAILLLPMCYFFGSFLFIFLAWIGWLKAPAWLVRAVAGVFCAGLSILSVAAAGWYIAIAAFVPPSVGILGLIFGALALPRIAHTRQRQLSVSAQVAGIGLACLGMAAFLARMFLK